MENEDEWMSLPVCAEGGCLGGVRKERAGEVREKESVVNVDLFRCFEREAVREIGG